MKTKDVPENTVVAGVPAKSMREIRDFMAFWNRAALT